MCGTPHQCWKKGSKRRSQDLEAEVERLEDQVNPDTRDPEVSEAVDLAHYAASCMSALATARFGA